MVKIYTSTIRYSGDDRLDITVKGHSPFGPAWGMVMGIKNGTMTEEEYTEQYYSMIRRLYTSNKGLFRTICGKETITFCCYCKSGTFCHRYLLASIFTTLGCTYEGEV